MGRTVGFSHFSMGHLGHVWDVPTTPWTLGREGFLGIVMANLDMSVFLMIIYTCFTNFLSRRSLDCSTWRDVIRSTRATRIAYTYAHACCPCELSGSCDVYVQSTMASV